MRATEFTVHAIWRTGICRMAMKARKDANSPMVSAPASTFSPPTHSTRPMETKKAKVIVVVLLTKTSMRRCAMASARREIASKRAISNAWDTKARTTRMPPRFSSMTRVSTASSSWSAYHRVRSRSRASEAPSATKGTKLSARHPEQHVSIDIISHAPPTTRIASRSER